MQFFSSQNDEFYWLLMTIKICYFISKIGLRGAHNSEIVPIWKVYLNSFKKSPSKSIEK
jgi:hypothetical protein